MTRALHIAIVAGRAPLAAVTRALGVAIVAGCAQPPCADLAEGPCLARGDCAPVYRYGACDGCPPVFERCGDDDSCAGEQEWTCSEEPPPCAAPECVPSPDDPCAASPDASACLAAGCLWVSYDVQCGPRPCVLEQCRNPSARRDCAQFRIDPVTCPPDQPGCDDPTECAQRPDCVVREPYCRPGDCAIYCRAACEDDADCAAHEECRDDAQTGVATCEAERCELLSCS